MPKKKPNDGYVALFVPRGQSSDDPHVFLSVDGVNYLLPKGCTSRVPSHIAAEYRRCLRAQEALERTVEDLLEASRL